MENTKQVFNLIILDESGSMQSIKEFIISGFNELVQSVRGVQSQFPDQEHLITLLSFNSNGTRTLLDLAPVEQLQPIDAGKYRPDAMTPLYDAMGTGISRLRGQLEGKSNYNVLVTILTDGEENASKEYDNPAIKSLVGEMKNAGWTFTYIGTDHDIEKAAGSINIHNVMYFSKSQSGVSQMFDRERKARAAFSERISKKENVQEDFYEDEMKNV